MSTNAYMADYMRRRYHTRRAQAITILGGDHPCCALCASGNAPAVCGP